MLKMQRGLKGAWPCDPCNGQVHSGWEHWGPLWAPCIDFERGVVVGVVVGGVVGGDHEKHCLPLMPDEIDYLL